ncbi:MAG: hypothetical protein HN737_06370 [Desulfobacterales bacterium]|nr:hypothetical protein [Desulfobacterales bacterium]
MTGATSALGMDKRNAFDILDKYIKYLSNQEKDYKLNPKEENAVQILRKSIQSDNPLESKRYRITPGTKASKIGDCSGTLCEDYIAKRKVFDDEDTFTLEIEDDFYIERWIIRKEIPFSGQPGEFTYCTSVLKKLSEKEGRIYQAPPLTVVKELHRLMILSECKDQFKDHLNLANISKAVFDPFISALYVTNSELAYNTIGDAEESYGYIMAISLSVGKVIRKLKSSDDNYIIAVSLEKRIKKNKIKATKRE